MNSRERNFTEKKLARSLKQIDEKIEAYLRELDEQDQRESHIPQPSAEELKKKIESLRSRKRAYQKMQKSLEGSEDRQVSLTDPDSRSMKVHHGTDVGYNVQSAVDAKKAQADCRS